MTPPPPSASSTAPKAAPEADRTPLPEKPFKSSAPDSHNRLELRGGARLGIPDSYQLELGAAFRPTRLVSIGGGIQSDFRDRLALFGEVGLRFHPTRRVSIQPTFLAGIGRLFGLETQAGRLAERVSLDGTYFLLNPELRLGIQVSRRVGLSFGLGYAYEARGAAQPAPSRLMSGESPNPGAHLATLSLGLTFGFLPKGAQAKTQETKIPPKKVQEPFPAPKPALEKLKPGSEEKIQAQVTEIKKGLSETQAKKFDEEVGEVRGRIASLKRSLTRLSAGMNRTNQITRRITEIRYRLMRDPAYRVPKSDPFWNDLTALHRAVQLESKGKPVSMTEESKEIRNGLRVLYAAAKTEKTYGERMKSAMEQMIRQLKGRKQNAAANRIAWTASTLGEFLKATATPIRIEDFKQEMTSLEESTGRLKPLAQEMKLIQNPAWIGLEADLNLLKNEVGRKVREVAAFGHFVSIVNGPENDFIRHVQHPLRGRFAFENALRFGDELPRIEAYRDVTLAMLQKTYADFFGLLELNLGTFIEDLTPPRLKNLAARKRWSPAVVPATLLLCRLKPRHPECFKPLGVPTPEPRTKPAVTPRTPRAPKLAPAAKAAPGAKAAPTAKTAPAAKSPPATRRPTPQPVAPKPSVLPPPPPAPPAGALPTRPLLPPVKD